MTFPISLFTPQSPRSSYLYDSAEVAVSSELQALFLGPGLDVAELLPEDRPPVVAAQPRVCVRHQLVEEPHVDEVEELREQLDGESGVHSTSPKQRHRPRQRVKYVLCEEERERERDQIHAQHYGGTDS